MWHSVSLWALGALAIQVAHAQNVPIQVTVPSNDSSDLYPVSMSPRFLLNGTEFPDLPVISLAPLGPYANVARSDFPKISIVYPLINVDAENSNSVPDKHIAYISCDPESYGGYINASSALANIIYSGSSTVIVILYSEHSNHCNVSNLSSAPGIDGILTTINPMAASTLAKLSLSLRSNGTATILPDLNSYTNSSSDSTYGNNGNLLGPSPTTAVAMIILYSITGIITALFITIIITGAVRAHRHPERAMLETLPIVKFGDHDDLPPKPADAPVDPARDIEMNPARAAGKHGIVGEKAELEVPLAAETATHPSGTTEESTTAATATPPHDGTTADGALSCSICTEDFTRGEEVRVLPCNHKFHPDCVDPWLLNVSGTCPLCRIDLRPAGERRG